MKSRSSRQKSDLRIRPEHLSPFLQDGSAVAISSPEARAAADRLAGLGLISVQTKEYVRCSNAEDRDFPPRNRHCRGRIVVGGAAAKGALHCPECERLVYPEQYGKRRYSDSRVQVQPENVIRYIAGLVDPLGPVEERGVFRVDVDGQEVTVCVADYTAPKFLARERASQIPTCFVVVSPVDVEERFLKESWVRRVTLAEVVADTHSLQALVRQVAAEGPPTLLLNASIPIFENGPSSVIVESPRVAIPHRTFIVEVGDNVVHVNGVKVVARQAGPRFFLFRALWGQFLKDLKEGLPPDAFSPTPAADLTQLLEARSKGTETIDELSIRRTINRLQADIESQVKKELGIPVGREDIVETCRKSGQTDTDFGYRLNPITVVVRPRRPDMSH
jgi:hypothetical protein